MPSPSLVSFGVTAWEKACVELTQWHACSLVVLQSMSIIACAKAIQDVQLEEIGCSVGEYNKNALELEDKMRIRKCEKRKHQKKKRSRCIKARLCCSLCSSAILSICKNNGWHATHFPVEVGSRGWAAHSSLTCLKKPGFSASWRKKVRRECSRVALRCSYLLYVGRSIHTWNSWLVGTHDAPPVYGEAESRLPAIHGQRTASGSDLQALCFLC